MESNKIYYVYEWIRLDTNEPFYVGKGKDKRCYSMNRGNNKHFYNIVNSKDCAVNILHDKLTEQEAHALECWYINEYKYEIGYNMTNVTDGGEGTSGYKFSEEYNKKNRMRINGFDIEDFNDQIINMYLNENMSIPDIANELNVSKTPIQRVLGKYSTKRTSGETLSINQKGLKRYNAKCIIVKDVHNNIVACFECQAECGDWLVEIGLVKQQKGGIKAVSTHCDMGTIYKGLSFFSCDKDEYKITKTNSNKFVEFNPSKDKTVRYTNSPVIEIYDKNDILVKTCLSNKECAEWLVEIKLSNCINSANNSIERNCNNNKYYKNKYTFVKYTSEEYYKKVS